MIRSSNSNFAVGLGFLGLGYFTLFPGMVGFVPVAILLLSAFPYWKRHRDLQRAAEEAAMAPA
jgi:hypothetical protein